MNTQHKEQMANKKKTVLLYGISGSGKSTQLALLAEHVYRTTGKTTRLYTGDRGGLDPIDPYIELGLVEVVEMNTTDPFMFMDKASKGMVRDAKTGKWVAGKNDNIGMFAFESLRSLAESMMESLANKAEQGINIGGGSNVNFTVQSDGETLKIGGNNPSHYGIVQGEVTKGCWATQLLPAPYIVWTSSVSKDDDTISNSRVIGPDVIGKALTSEVPRWFGYTFRLDVVPAAGDKPERHLLYLGSSLDSNAGNAKSLGNTRMPLDGPKLPNFIEPANVVNAIQLIEDGKKAAALAITARIAEKATV